MVRVAVIGANFGGRFMAPAYEDANFTVADVVSARDESAVIDVINNARVDLVSVHSPPFLHSRHVEMAFEARKAVLCDKPFGANLDDATHLARIARETGLFNALNFEFRFLPIRRTLKQLIDDGAIGTPERVLWTSESSLSRDPMRPFGWIFEESLGGGWLRAWGSHAVDHAAWLFGSVKARDARLFRTLAERPDPVGELHAVTADDGFAIALDTVANVDVRVSSSFAAPVTLPEQLLVVGNEAVLALNADVSLAVMRPGQETEIIEDHERVLPPVPHALRLLLADLREAMQNGTEFEATFEAGLACARVLDDLADLAAREPRGHDV